MKYIIRDTSTYPWFSFCVCSTESDAEEMVLALSEEELYQAWFSYTQIKEDDEPDFWENIRTYKERCFAAGNTVIYKTLFCLAIYCDTPNGWDYMEIEEV